MRIISSNYFPALLILLNINTPNVIPQANQDWLRTFNGTGNNDDAAKVITADNDGDIYVTGYSTVNGNAQKITTIKYNSSGDQLWTAVYTGPGSYQYGDEGLDIAVDNSGYVYVTGSSAAGATEYTLDYVTIKYDSSGTEQWASRYNSPSNEQDIAFAITLDDSGNVYVTGQSGHPSLNSNIATIKYNSSGEVKWIAEFDGIGDRDTGKDLVVDNSGNVYVTGFYSTDFGTAFLDFITLKYDSQGNQLWAQGYNGTGNNSDESVAVDLDSSGNIYITGFSTGSVYDIATIKYDPAGNQQWLQIYSSSSPSIDVPSGMAADAAGNIYITGAVSFDIGTLKYNTNGDLQWDNRYDYNGNFDAGNTIVVDVEGNVFAAGVSQSGTFESTSDYATIKYSPSGDELWVERYNGASGNWDEANSVSLDNSGNIYVTGFSTINGNYDFATIKYSEEVIPVELISFSAAAGEEGTVILTWSTSSENNNRGFEIQRSINEQGFDAIGFVEGNGTTTQDHHYSFRDINVSGTIRYRLKQIDFNGNFKFSEIIESAGSKNISFKLLQNIPNPFNPTTTIKYLIPELSFVTLKVYDVLGNEIATLVNEMKSYGNYEVKFDANGLSSGVYLYKLQARDLVSTRKMILLR